MTPARVARLVFRPMKVYTGMARTSTSVIIVSMAVEMENKPGFMLKWPLTVKSQYAEIGVVWKMTTRKVAIIKQRLIALITCQLSISKVQKHLCIALRQTSHGLHTYMA